MPLHPALTEKSLQLPRRPLDDAQLEEKLNTFFKSHDLYGREPDHTWSKVGAWRESRFFTQLLGKLIPAYKRLASGYGLDLQGFDVFWVQFNGGRNFHNTLRNYPPNPDPFEKAPYYYNDLKLKLERIYFFLTQDQSLSPDTIKKHLTYLSEQLRACGPGVHAGVSNVEHELTTIESLPYWLEKTRDDIVRELSEELMAVILKREARQWTRSTRPRFSSRDLFLKWFEENYNSHVHTTLQKLAESNNFPIFKSQAVTKFNDEHQRRLPITQADRRWFKDEIFRRYTPKHIHQSLLFHLSSALLPLRNLNFSDPDNLERLIQLLSPFLDRQIFSIGDIALKLSDDEIILSPTFSETLPDFMKSLLVESGYIQDFALKQLQATIDKIESDYTSRLWGEEKSNPNPLRMASIKQIKAELKAILALKGLSRSEKLNCAIGLIKNHIEQINSEHHIVRQWLKVPLRFIFLPFLETRLEQKLNTYLTQLQRFKREDKTNPLEIYNAKKNSILVQLKINQDNEALDKACCRILQKWQASSDSKKTNTLYLLRYNASNIPCVFDTDNDKKPLFHLKKTQMLTLQDIHTIAVCDKFGIIRLKKTLSKSELLNARPVTQNDISIDFMNQYLNIQRLRTLTNLNFTIINAASISEELIVALSKLHPLYLMNTRDFPLSLFSIENLSKNNIQRLNKHINESTKPFDLLKRVNKILSLSLPLDKLSLLEDLPLPFFTEKESLLLTILAQQNKLDKAGIKQLNKTIKANGDTQIGFVAPLLQYPGFILDKLPSLITLPTYLYESDGGLSLLKKMQDALPSYEAEFKALMLAVTPAFKMPLSRTPASMKNAQKKRIQKTILNASLILKQLPLSCLKETSTLEAISAQKGDITDVFIKTLARRFEPQPPPDAISTPKDVAQATPPSSRSFFSLW